MRKFSKAVLGKMDITDPTRKKYDDTRKYYVYGLIDPFTYHVFYVGKGCENRVFDHACDAIKTKDTDEEVSLKIKTIKNIIARGKEVITIIYHWGLTEEESLLIESTLMDVFPGLTNVQDGYDAEHSMISTEDLQNNYSRPVYDEPKDEDGNNIPYMLIKLKDNIDERGGDLYKVVRGCWRNSLDKASGYHYVLAVVRGVVKQVYEVDNWHLSKMEAPRIEFDGKPTTNPKMKELIDKLIPEDYRKQGMANPAIYCNE